MTCTGAGGIALGAPTHLGKRLAEWVAVLCDGRKELSPHVTKYKRNQK